MHQPYFAGTPQAQLIDAQTPKRLKGMTAEAIARMERELKIARALDINVRSIAGKVQLLDGICEEAVGLLKDKMCPLAVFDVLRKLNPLRQIEAAELLINGNNFSISYAPDATLLTFQDLGPGSVAHLRETLGLPSCDGVRPR